MPPSAKTNPLPETANTPEYLLLAISEFVPLIGQDNYSGAMSVFEGTRRFRSDVVCITDETSGEPRYCKVHNMGKVDQETAALLAK